MDIRILRLTENFARNVYVNVMENLLVEIIALSYLDGHITSDIYNLNSHILYNRIDFIYDKLMVILLLGSNYFHILEF